MTYRYDEVIAHFTYYIMNIRGISFYMVIGIAVGAAIGVSMDDMSYGIAVGAAVGLIIGFLVYRKRK